MHVISLLPPRMCNPSNSGYFYPIFSLWDGFFSFKTKSSDLSVFIVFFRIYNFSLSLSHFCCSCYTTVANCRRLVALVVSPTQIVNSLWRAMRETIFLWALDFYFFFTACATHQFFTSLAWYRPTPFRCLSFTIMWAYLYEFRMKAW